MLVNIGVLRSTTFFGWLSSKFVFQNNENVHDGIFGRLVKQELSKDAREAVKPKTSSDSLLP